MNKDDKDLLNYFISIYELNINNNMSNKKQNFNIILDKEHIPNKLIDIFYKRISNNTYMVLANNALLYGLQYNKVDFINKFIDYKNKDINNLDDNFKKDLIIYGINCILCKCDNIIVKEGINFIKNKFNNLFIKESSSINISTINELYRNIIFSVINKYPIEEQDNIMNYLLTSNMFDEDILSLSDNLIKSNNLNYFKNYLFRIIIEDTYILLKAIDYDYNNNLFKNIMLNNELEYLYKSGEFSKLFNPLKNDLLKYINNCIKNNDFKINSNPLLMDGLYRTFILSLRLKFINSKTINLLEKYGNKSNLEKINPCYKLDKIKRKEN